MGKKLFQRGFGKVRDKMREKGRYIANCNSCRYFYKDAGDSEENCHNGIVTKFDMTEENGRTFCTFWRCEGEYKDENF